MRDRASQFSEQYQHNYSVLATPAEGLSGKFTRIDRKVRHAAGHYGTVTTTPTPTTCPYTTNAAPATKRKRRLPYHELTRGGHIFMWR